MPYKDRTVGLVAFGILTILLGIGALGIGVLVIVSQSLVPQDQNLGHWARFYPASWVYGILGIALIVLGIGSMMAKRWARALLLVFSWCWLVLGVIEMVAMAVILPQVFAHATALSASADKAAAASTVSAIAMVITFGFLGFFFILLPGIWTFFYMSPHVKATCEARDPNPSWTDACPLPVLAISLWMWICVPTMLLMPFSGHLVLPLFGTFVTGLPAAFFSLCFAAAWALGGWLTFRLDLRGWWLIVIVVLLGTVSSVVTFSLHSMLDLYRAGNYPPAIIEQTDKLGIFKGPTFAWLMGLMMLPFLGYLIFIHRYFLAK